MKGRKLISSTFLSALVTFSLLNLAVWPIFNAYKLYVVDEEIGIRQFLSEKGGCKLVLLGSSVISSPFWLLDHSKVRLSHYVRPVWLESELAKQTGKKESILNLSAPGQVFSDDLFIVDAYLKPPYCPNWLIVGICPRDCYDYQFPTPGQGKAFRQMAGLAQFMRYQEIYLPTAEDKLQYLLERVCFFYAKRGRMQMQWQKTVRELCAHLTAKTSSAKGEPTINDWEHWMSEWRDRLRGFRVEQATTQLDLLERMLEICREERHINVILINMPLDSSFDELLPPGFYSIFNRRIQSLVSRYDVHYIPLDHSSLFQRADFNDPVHLNRQGAEKFAGILLKKLIQLRVIND